MLKKLDTFIKLFFIMMKIKSLENLLHVTQTHYPNIPNMTDLSALVLDWVKTIKIENKTNYFVITYQFKVSNDRYQEVKELLGNVELTTHRWNGVHQKYITVTISQKFNTFDLQRLNLMYSTEKGLFYDDNVNN